MDIKYGFISEKKRPNEVFKYIAKYILLLFWLIFNR